MLGDTGARFSRVILEHWPGTCHSVASFRVFNFPFNFVFRY